MNDTHAPSAVLVGIDGSQAALGAALWAVDEAVSRNVPLRLLYAVKVLDVPAHVYAQSVEKAKSALHAAEGAVHATGKPVTVQTEILDGPPGAVLVEESEGAEMICVASVGIGRYARSILGSTAAELAENAHCPVAVIRPPDPHAQAHVSWILVAIDDKPGHTAVVQRAMEEARLRGTPVLALGTEPTAVAGDALAAEVDKWQSRFPDVHIYPIADRADVADFLRKHDEPVELAVIDASDAGDLAEIIGPRGHRVFAHPVASALVVRS